MASILCWYSFLSMALCERPMVWLDFTPSPASSGSMKVSKKSRNSALAFRTTARTSWLTSVLNTTGWVPFRFSASMRARQSSAFSALSTKGRVTWLNSTPSNWVNRLWPSICAVMPVPSETKNTVRRCVMTIKYQGMHVAWLKDLRMSDLAQVGGKNASLGEMIGALSKAQVRVPGGFATTAQAFRSFLAGNGLDARIAERIKALNPEDVEALARCGAEVRGWIEKAPFPEDVERDIRLKYQELVKDTSESTSFAVRSSAT